MVEEAIDGAADLRGATGTGALPTDGRVQLGEELEDVRQYARQALGEEDYSSDGAGEIFGWDSEGYEGSLEEFSARSDGGFEANGPAEAEGDGDVWCATTVTAAAPADMAGTANFPGDADDVGASVLLV